MISTPGPDGATVLGIAPTASTTRWNPSSAAEDADRPWPNILTLKPDVLLADEPTNT